MSNRRDLLLGMGAGIGVTALALGAAGWRTWRGHQLGYGFAATGASVEGLGRQPLRCTAGTLTSGRIEGPFYSPKTPERRDIRDPLVAALALNVQLPIAIFAQTAALEHLEFDIGIPWFVVPLAFVVLAGATVHCLLQLRRKAVRNYGDVR